MISTYETSVCLAAEDLMVVFTHWTHIRKLCALISRSDEECSNKWFKTMCGDIYSSQLQMLEV